MKITINIPESVVAILEERVGLDKVADEAERLVYRYCGVPADDRAVLISGEARKQLEAILQTTVDDGAKLVSMLKNMGSLKIGTIERVFSPSELVRLQDQARFHGWTEEKFLKMTSEEALDYIMNRM